MKMWVLIFLSNKLNIYLILTVDILNVEYHNTKIGTTELIKIYNYLFNKFKNIC